MFDIITFGSATKDIAVKPKNTTVLPNDKKSLNQEMCFPLGSKIDIEEIQFNTGGGGTNSAATFANQGFKTTKIKLIKRINSTLIRQKIAQGKKWDHLVPKEIFASMTKDF